LFKKDAIKSRGRVRKIKDEDNPQNIGMEFVDKQIINNSRLNASSRIENKDKLKQLEELFQSGASHELILKVTTSVSDLHKGTIIRLDCQGIKNIENKRKDGITYFGSPQITNSSLDYVIPLAENQEKT
jgi:hypothetical protein